MASTRLNHRPSLPYCLSCNHSLVGLRGPACPECNRLFDIGDPDSYGLSNRPARAARGRSSYSSLQIVLMVLLAATACFVANVEGIHIFMVWNCIPLILAALFVRFAVREVTSPRRPLKHASVVFVMLTAGMTWIGHEVWLNDWNQTASGSSTSALMFLFLPIWTILLATGGAVITWLFSSVFLSE